ncbi:uncharacterized protein GVI51_M10725 [Nakaseomyces glabratus]|uniref:COBW domain-containing protein 1 n=2 Tax=Candida glabrata TaxID=5478 RepID=Q6FIY0_CANGA|nr:uncharacterized protein CAGL0M10747g [Nakaseomyces glabratus]KAH7579754.1 Cobalamin synthesis protein cobW C-terminal domain [Nakaseomyces glabratus]KAH7592935.1 Cobalamin synthesis protein cobW C-terminal domain [Nakaseomyces glabratus]KAH7594006.1 Cobalamin synthesis protein cobW C-terminal domain [Nakaseomyces glabratus]KAH7600456.1 Cobalamin synthesis protein cobW C-terminal domain [Nakaseomyces glabratus]KAH7610779.1 Cobalamin synthesis protein cobW C-terminal domain [Nakaseomyces glab|eukprot:XP_449814.1 uncharacterized protein CAGL0M10747g [[Candida] glabrata]
MSLKNYKHDEDDGELPPLVTGRESNLAEILGKVRNDGGHNLVSADKVDRSNKQVEVPLSSNSGIQTEKKRIPVTIITGYLGSGKSTLLEKIALKGSDRKIAVILNEFGDSSEIEKAMTIQNGDSKYQEWLDLGNGCLCCSLKNIGVKAIEDMIERSPGSIDYILLETSGIADPAPIAKMFWQDEGLNSSVYIDGIITVLDAEHIVKCLDDVSPDAHWYNQSVVKEENLTIAYFQIAMADRILLNKVDKIEGKRVSISDIEARIKDINGVAPIYHTQYGEVSLDKLLDLHAYEGTDLNLDGSFKDRILQNEKVMHDHRMGTVTLSFRPLKTEQEFENFKRNFLQKLLWKNFGLSDDDEIKNLSKLSDDWEIERSKGLVLVADSTYVIQGVRDTFDIFTGHSDDTISDCKLVLIGKYLDKDSIQKLLLRVIDSK